MAEQLMELSAGPTMTQMGLAALVLECRCVDAADANAPNHPNVARHDLRSRVVDADSLTRRQPF
jgi:hypothetical protein